MPVPEGTLGGALTDAAKDGLLDLAVGYVTAGLEDFLYASTELPSFLADPNPPSLAAQPLKQITRFACQTYARGGGPQNLPGFDAAWGGICGPYLDSIGENPTPGTLARPFTGGQCYGVTYRVITSWNSPPLGAQTNEQQVGGRVVGTFRGDKQPNQTTPVGIELQSAPGAATTRLNITSLADEYLGSFSIQSVSPLSGGEDLCGDPPAIYDPPKVKPGLPGLPPSTPVDFPGIGPIGVGINFDPDGTINVSLPDIGVDVGIEDPFGLGDGDGGDGGGGEDPPPGDVGEPAEPEDTGEDGEASGCASEGSELVGLHLVMTAFPPSRNKYTDEVFRGAVYVYMGVEELLDLDPAGAMITEDQFVFAEREGLTCWRVRANKGYRFDVTPYYREVE
jgi:hypothetical protein